MSELDKILKKMKAFLDGEEIEMSMDFGDVLTIYNALLEATGKVITLADFISVFNTEKPLDLLIFDSKGNFRAGYHDKETIPETLLDAGILSAVNHYLNSISIKLNITIDGED